MWQNTPVEIVDITDADNNVVTVYFQQTTKLPVRQVSIGAIRKPRRGSKRSQYSPSTAMSVAECSGRSISLSERNGEKAVRDVL